MTRTCFFLFVVSVRPGVCETVHVCPSEISVASTVNTVPNGWQLRGSSPGLVVHQLTGATFSDGDPEEKAFLKPHEMSSDTAGRRHKQTYRFTARYPDGIWLICTYQGTTVNLTKRLSDTPRQCSVSQIADRSGSVKQTITCQ